VKLDSLPPCRRAAATRSEDIEVVENVEEVGPPPTFVVGVVTGVLGKEQPNAHESGKAG